MRSHPPTCSRSRGPFPVRLEESGRVQVAVVVGLAQQLPEGLGDEAGHVVGGRDTGCLLLTQEDCENTVVHGVTGVAIKAAYHEEARRIDGCESALAGSEEIPDAAQEYESTQGSEKGCTH